MFTAAQENLALYGIVEQHYLSKTLGKMWLLIHFATYFISNDIYEEYAIGQTRKCDGFSLLDPPIQSFVLNDVIGQLVALENTSRWSMMAYISSNTTHNMWIENLRCI